MKVHMKAIYFIVIHQHNKGILISLLAVDKYGRRFKVSF